jgi:RNA polymerase sigma-70 factor (ECF subfamily)
LGGWLGGGVLSIEQDEGAVVFSLQHTSMPLTVQEINDLVRIWTPRLVLFARQWTDSVDDAIQEAFLNLYRQPTRPDDEVAWLFRATRNAAICIQRSETRRTRRQGVVARAAPNWFEPNDESRLDAETVKEKLRELPSELREVVVARLWGGLSFEQIAASTDSTRETTRRRYHEAIAALRKNLGIE